MRRADRLFSLILLLGGKRVTTAARLARSLEVSERTVYRDIADLKASGVPIEGEAGVGFRMRRGYSVPPLMFTPEEIQALVFGARLVQSCADEGLYEVLTQAAQFYRDSLRETPRAKKYLADRGITTESCVKFAIGYAPDEGHRAASFDWYRNHSLRTTWQATEKHRFGFYGDIQKSCRCTTGP